MPTDKYLSHCRLSRDVCTNPDTLIPEYSVWRLFQYVARREAIPDFGYEVSKALSVNKMGTIGEHKLSASESFTALNRFINSMPDFSSCTAMQTTQFAEIKDVTITLLRQGFFKSPVKAEDIAYHYGMSVRSLQRHLKTEKTSLREIINQDLHDRAKDLLREHGTNVSEVASQLGYSDIANFTRAFKSQAGISPMQYKKGCSIGL